MIRATEFRMVELMTSADFAEHSVWADFHEERDRTRILSWGVTGDRLDAEIERYDYCGRSPLYPVLDVASTDELANPSVALVFTTRSALELPGYRLGQLAFGVYAGDREFCLNPSLPGRARVELAKLAKEIDKPLSDVETLCYAVPPEWEGRLEAAGIGPVRGELSIE
ncbi:MAG: hypothetical protein VX246_14795 [Myxococcota bacterium]|nr:hypothetical protein [Myxococcota bacterium]